VYAPNSSRRPITSRSFTRASEVDYDEIPSPKSHLSVRPSTNGRGPSALSKSFSARGPTPDPDFDHASPPTFVDFELPQLDDDPPRSPTPEASPEDAGEDEELAEVEVIAQSKKVDKGKRRADPVEDDEPSNPEPHDANGIEEDIAQGLEEVDNAQDGEDSAPQPKKPRKEQAKPPKPRPEKRVIKTPAERVYCEAGACVLDSDNCRFPYPRRGATRATPPLQALGVVAARESCLWAA
jgi:centromere protein C